MLEVDGVFSEVPPTPLVANYHNFPTENTTDWLNFYTPFDRADNSISRRKLFTLSVAASKFCVFIYIFRQNTLAGFLSNRAD